MTGLNLESFEKILHGGAFGLTESVILTLSLISGIGKATQNVRLMLIVGVTSVLVHSSASSFGHLVEGLTEREEQCHRRNHDKVETEISSILEIMENAFLCFVVSMVAAIPPILPFYILPLETAMMSSMMMGIGMVFIMGCLAGKLGEEKNPTFIGLEYAAIAIIGIQVTNLLVDLLWRASPL